MIVRYLELTLPRPKGTRFCACISFLKKHPEPTIALDIPVQTSRETFTETKELNEPKDGGEQGSGDTLKKIQVSCLFIGVSTDIDGEEQNDRNAPVIEADKEEEEKKCRELERSVNNGNGMELNHKTFNHVAFKKPTYHCRRRMDGVQQHHCSNHRSVQSEQ